MWHHTTLEYVHKTTISFTYLSSYQQVGRWETCCKVLLRKRKDRLTSKASLESPIKRCRSPRTSRLRDLKWNSKLNPGVFPASLTLRFQMRWEGGGYGGRGQRRHQLWAKVCSARANGGRSGAWSGAEGRVKAAWYTATFPPRGRADLWRTFCLF